jgi:hypothetical protein
MILVPSGIIGSQREGHLRARFDHAVKDLFEGGCDGFEDIGTYASHGYDEDPFHVMAAS